jgi:lipoprotein signal peptidase
MFNVFDRAIGFNLAYNGLPYHDVVLDYFQFSFKWGIFNFPDVFVLTGIIGGCVLYIIFSIMALIRARKQDNNVRA